MSDTTDVEKTVSPDRTYIDYTHGNSGMRVSEGKLRLIERTDKNAAWRERERTYSLPIDDRFQQWPPDDLKLVPLCVLEIDALQDDENGRELRELIRDGLSFDEAMSTSHDSSSTGDKRAV